MLNRQNIKLAIWKQLTFISENKLKKQHFSAK